MDRFRPSNVSSQEIEQIEEILLSFWYENVLK